MYAVDTVLVNAGMKLNTVTGPSVVEGAAAGVSVELEVAVGEVEAAAAAVGAGELEEDDAEDVAVIRKDG